MDVIYMDKKLIKVLNQKLANQLVCQGFEYMLENVNGEEVYVFLVSETILKNIQGNFEKKDLIFENSLRF